MRITFTCICLLMTAIVCGQLKVFRQYPFEKGGYAIIGLRADAKPDPLSEALGEFYTDDPSVLEQFRRTWVFTNRTPDQHCGYHYSIQVTYKGKIVEDLLVNLACKVIATGKGFYYFNPAKLEDLASQLKKPVIKKYSFDSTAQGNRFIDSIRKEKNLLLTFEPFWTKYQGSFTFTFRSPEGSKTNPAILEKRLREGLRKKYPGQSFVLSFDRAESPQDHVFRIITNKPLYDRFTAYPKSQWRRYEPELTTAWRLP